MGGLGGSGRLELGPRTGASWVPKNVCAGRLLGLAWLGGGLLAAGHPLVPQEECTPPAPLASRLFHIRLLGGARAI